MNLKVSPVARSLSERVQPSKKRRKAVSAFLHIRSQVEVENEQFSSELDSIRFAIEEQPPRAPVVAAPEKYSQNGLETIFIST
jgi:hypothetical protein